MASRFNGRLEVFDIVLSVSEQVDPLSLSESHASPLSTDLTSPACTSARVQTRHREAEAHEARVFDAHLVQRWAIRAHEQPITALMLTDSRAITGSFDYTVKVIHSFFKHASH